ncbi:FAD binding domain-containing protein [Texcoconibacillus texcoconensis]|uniref:CO/xanthine dehydrogenase FAD-binding subunit n=1 Tax=Texcoconibacillus texcoconensis TaxID=1095777 RepID=A0A840QLN6_9BACI|nr:CO/xanthine dehydrogenase FAD-binding subunit [Texcoconibacillus texcoconensis]
MIPFDFDYYKPSSVEEAVRLFESLRQQGKQPMYFSGGTEIITFGRLDYLYTNAVIDIKGISKCQMMTFKGENLYLGAAVSLSEIEEANLFPLLTKTSSEVADHTARTKVTLGGNICGKIFYREAVLPFLVSESEVVIASREGEETRPILDVFQKSLQLEEGECLVQLVTNKKMIEAANISIKRRRQWDTGYPVITVVGIKVDGQLRVAISGLCSFPFRAKEMEPFLNDTKRPLEERVSLAIRHVPAEVLHDSEASSDYRMFVLKNTLLDVFEGLEMEEVR